ncbi:hypothetical protein PG987_012303 [Apiospora arundinis]
MLRDKYQSVEDKIKRTRHKTAWIGLFLVCGIATMIVIVSVWFIVLEVKAHGSKPVEEVDSDHEGTLLGTGEEHNWIPVDVLDQTDVFTLAPDDQNTEDRCQVAATATASPLPALTEFAGGSSHIPALDSHVAPHIGGGDSPQKRKIVYSTTTVFVLPPATTPAPPTATVTPEVSKTVDSSTLPMTGNMYCPDPQRPHVLTLCNYVHTPVPGMVDADQVRGSMPVASSAGGGQSATNPFVTLRLALLGIWAHVRQSVSSAVPSYAAVIRRHSKSAVTDLENLHLCAATTGELWGKTRKLQESLDDALMLVQFQQGLLNSQEGIIESQRLNLEEMARLLVFVQNQTAATTTTTRHTTTANTWANLKHQKVM